MTKRMGFIIVIAGILSFVIPATAQVPVVFQQGLGGYSGTHDTFYQTGDPAAIHGAEDEWEWDDSDAGGANYGFIRFDDITGTESWQIPPNTTILSAVLKLYVTDQGGSADVFDLLTPFDDTQDFFSFGDGSGAEPLPGADYAEDPAGTAIETTGTGIFHEIDLTASVQNIVNGGANNGWVFVYTSGGGHVVASSEATSNQPMLIVMIEGTAPPAGVREFSIGGLATKGFNPGDAVKVTIKLTNDSGVAANVVETIPAGWTASNISDGGTATGGVISWSLAAFSGEKSISYTATSPSDAGTFATFSGSINDLIVQLGDSKIRTYVPLYKTGNVLAVGMWNGDNGSSDLAVTADLSDNNGVIYVQDTSAEGGWPAGTIFRWKTVLYDDGFGEEEPGWQTREFTYDTEDNYWIEQTDVGFTIGHGGNDAENGETSIDASEETVYTRSIFDAQNYESINELVLKMVADDEAVAWLNGVFIGYTASGTSDRGETAEDYVFDTTISGGSGGLEGGDNPSTYPEGSGFSIPVTLMDAAPPVSVPNWPLY